MKSACLALLWTAAGLVGSPARADILVDKSPQGPLYFTGRNIANDQNFVVQFRLQQRTRLTAFDVFTEPEFGAVGQPVVVKIKADENDIPAPLNLYRLADTVDEAVEFRPGVRMATVHFQSVLLKPGVYWMGVSGATQELGWSSFQQGVQWPPGQFLLNGDTPSFAPGFFQLGYRIQGQTVPIPEPHALWLAASGLAVLGWARHRQKSRARP